MSMGQMYFGGLKKENKSDTMTLDKKDIQDLIELVNEKIKECKESDSAFMRGALSYWRDLKKKLKEELKHASK